MGFVLYGGTAIALRLGHRQSVDFGFFTERRFDPERLVQRLPVLAGARVLQALEGTFTLSLDRPGGGQVRVSFFTAGMGRIGDPAWTSDGALLVASMEDLLAHKLKVLLQRVEAKDYLDVHALVGWGCRLEMGLAGARALFSRSFQPAEALKALTWFKGGDLEDLPEATRRELIAMATAVTDLPPAPVVQPALGGGVP